MLDLWVSVKNYSVLFRKGGFPSFTMWCHDIVFITSKIIIDIKMKNSKIMIKTTCLKESLVLASWIRASLKSASSATAWRSRLILVTTATTSGSVLFSSQRTFQQRDTKILAHLGYFVINLRTYWHTFYRAKQCSSDKYQVGWKSSALYYILTTTQMTTTKTPSPPHPSALGKASKKELGKFSK